jgi:S-formylglutathione hydrolase FrmB
VSAAVSAGAPPFVLAGTDDGPAGWLPTGDVDPQLMLREELPSWLGQRGYAAERMALWGWSRGGYGALRYVVSGPSWASALALFSPALHPGDPVLSDLDILGDLPWGLWCGESDPFRDGAVALADAAPVPPDPWISGEGAHTRIYWNEHTLDMLHWAAQLL